MALPWVAVNVVGVVVAAGSIHHNKKVVVVAVDNTAAYCHPVHLVLYPMNTKREKTCYGPSISSAKNAHILSACAFLVQIRDQFTNPTFKTFPSKFSPCIPQIASAAL